MLQQQPLQQQVPQQSQPPQLQQPQPLPPLQPTAAAGGTEGPALTAAPPPTTPQPQSPPPGLAVGPFRRTSSRGARRAAEQPWGATAGTGSSSAGTAAEASLDTLC